MYYEINDLLSVKTDIDVPIPDYYAVDRNSSDPDINFSVGDLPSFEPANPRRIGSRYQWDSSTGTLYLDWNVPLDLRASISGLGESKEQTVVKMTEQYHKRGSIGSLVRSVLIAELHTRDCTLIHGGCVSRSSGGAVITGWDDMGKTSTCLSMHDRDGFRFMGDDAVVLGADGRVHAWDSLVGISPYTSTGNIPMSIQKRARIIVKRAAKTVPGLGVLHSSREQIDVTDIIDPQVCRPETVFFLEGGEDGPRDITTAEGARRLVETSNADKSLVTHDAIKTYGYLHEDISGMFDTRQRIIKEALADMNVVELCSENKDDYPDWIASNYPSP
jgi:hypothetical protein